MKIVTEGILPASVSNQITVVSQSSVFLLNNNIPLLVISPTQNMSATTYLPSTTNDFSYGMPSMDILNMSFYYQLTSHALSVN
jgi:hypothetical protein